MKIRLIPHDKDKHIWASIRQAVLEVKKWPKWKFTGLENK